MLWQQIKCFGTGIKWPCHSKVSLAADMPCQLQVCELLGGSASNYLVSSTCIMILHCHLEPFAHCMCLLVYFVIGINSSYFHRPINPYPANVENMVSS